MVEETGIPGWVIAIIVVIGLVFILALGYFIYLRFGAGD